MTTARDLQSLRRLWSAVEGRYRNRCRFFQAQVTVDQLSRIDEQLQIALYALANACPDATLSDAQIPDARLTKPEFVFSHTSVNARRAGVDFPAYVALLEEQSVFESASLLQAVIEALLFLPEALLEDRLAQLCAGTSDEHALVLRQWAGCYLPVQQRRRFLAEDDDLLSAGQQGIEREGLLNRFQPLLSLLPFGEEMAWLMTSRLPVDALESTIESDPVVGFNLVAVTNEESTWPLIITGLQNPQTNLLAYHAWLFRTAATLPQKPLLQDSSNPENAAGPLLADALSAVEWLQQRDAGQQQTGLQQHALRLRNRTSLLDDCLWVAQGGLDRTGHLIRLHPYKRRLDWCGSAVTEDNDNDKDITDGY